ncbi:MAG: hypothetical protein ACI4I6_08230 [Hominimerdicola sp.]
MNIAKKINASIGKNFVVIGSVIVGLTVLIVILRFFFVHEKMTFVDYYYVNVTTYTKTKETEVREWNNTRNRYRYRTRYTTYYYVQFNGTNKELDLTFESINNDYYDYFSYFNGKDPVRVPVFKDESGELFPAMSVYECTEKQASKDYEKLHTSANKTIMLFGLILGVPFILIGLNAIKVSKKYEEDENPFDTPLYKSESIKEREKMSEELDRLLAEDKYGRYNNHKFK